MVKNFLMFSLVIINSIQLKIMNFLMKKLIKKKNHFRRLNNIKKHLINSKINRNKAILK